MLGKVESDLQENIVIDDAVGDSISGTSKYVTDYEGFDPSNPENQEGNYLALHIKGENCDKVEAGLDPSAGSGLVVIPDNEDDIVVKLGTDQKFVVQVTAGEDVIRQEFSLDNLVKEDEE